MALKYHGGKSHDTSTSQSCSYRLVLGGGVVFLLLVWGFSCLFGVFLACFCFYANKKLPISS